MPAINSEQSKSYVYIVKAGTKSTSPIKIGVTDNVQNRIKQLQTGNPSEIVLVMHFECNSREHAFNLEKTIHEILKGQRLFGEWFSVSKTKLMKMLNSMGDKEALDSVVKSMDIFDKHGTSQKKTTKLTNTIKSRNVEIKEVQDALVRGRLIRRIYVEELIRLGCSWKDIKELRRSAREEEVVGT